MPPVDFNGGQLKVKCTAGVVNVLSQLALLLILRKRRESDSVCITKPLPILRFAVVSTIAQ